MSEKVTVPDHWSRQDVNGFLRFIKPSPEDREERDRLRIEEPRTHCWKNGGCRFWIQTGKQEYQGYCATVSCSCATAVFNHKNPTRWLPRQ